MISWSDLIFTFQSGAERPRAAAFDEHATELRERGDLPRGNRTDTFCKTVAFDKRVM